MTTLRLFSPSAENGAAAPPPRIDKFAEKYRQFFPRVFAYVYGHTHNVHLAEDLVADVFERAFLKSDTLRNDEAFSTWLFTIARNVIISHARKRHRETVVDPDVLREIAPSGTSVEGDILLREEMRTVSKLLQDFPQREQDIVSLKFDAELTNAQIAQIMSLSEPNVRVILFRTLRKLREQMAAERRA